MWDDPWISDGLNQFVQTAQGLVASDLVVRDLLTDDYNGWNSALIDEVFDQEVATHIKALRLRWLNSSDCLSWRHYKNDIYGVKSGYLVLTAGDFVDQRSSAFTSSDWNWVWKIKAAPII